jgi:hypothetical protein
LPEQTIGRFNARALPIEPFDLIWGLISNAASHVAANHLNVFSSIAVLVRDSERETQFPLAVFREHIQIQTLSRG